MLDESNLDGDQSQGDSTIKLTHSQLMDLITKTQAVPQPKAPKAASPYQPQQAPARLAGVQANFDPQRPVTSQMNLADITADPNAQARTRIQAMEQQKNAQMATGGTAAAPATMSAQDAWKALSDQNPKATTQQKWATITAMAKAGAFKVKGADGGKGMEGIEGALYQNAIKQGKTPEQAAEVAAKYKRAGSAEAAATELAKKEADTKAKVEANQPKATAAMESMKSGVQNTLDFINMARKGVSGKTTGAGAYLANVKGTDAYNLSKTLDTIKSNIGFDKLQEMRTQSPTGSALGRVTNFEMQTLQNVVASLDQGQTEDQLNLHLDIAEKIMKHIDGAIQEDYERQYGKSAAAPAAADTGAKGAIDYSEYFK